MNYFFRGQTPHLRLIAEDKCNNITILRFFLLFSFLPMGNPLFEPTTKWTSRPFWMFGGTNYLFTKQAAIALLSEWLLGSFPY